MISAFVWVLQAVLAAMFVAAGLMKSTQPKAELADKLPWVEDFSPATVRSIGLAELAGGLGLVLPGLLGVATVLTPLAATGLAVVMVLAMATHARRREAGAIVFNLALLVPAVVIAWARFGPYAL